MEIRNISNKKYRGDKAKYVLVSSITSVIGRPTVTAYAASKGAMVSAVKSLSLELAKKGVKSSVKGTIIERMVDKGAVIEEGTPLFVVQPDSGYKASLLVSSDSIDRVEIGQKARVKLGEKSFEGKVSNIGQIATVDEDGEPKVKVDIALDGSKVTPTIGLEAQVEIFSKIKKSIIQIPSGCLHSDAEGDFVYVLDKGIAAKQHVITGDTSDGYIQITDGLNPGDQVIKSDIGEENVGKVYRVSN